MCAWLCKKTIYYFLLQTVVRRLLLDLPEDNFLLDAFRLVLELNFPLREAAVDPFLEDPFRPEREVDFFLLLVPPPLSELRLLFTFPVLLFFFLILLLAILPLVFVFFFF